MCGVLCDAVSVWCCAIVLCLLVVFVFLRAWVCVVLNCIVWCVCKLSCGVVCVVVFGVFNAVVWIVCALVCDGVWCVCACAFVCFLVCRLRGLFLLWLNVFVCVCLGCIL